MTEAGDGGFKPAVAASVGTHQEAATTLVNREHMRTTKFLNQILRASREKADPRIVEFYVRVQKECAKRGIPVFAHEFYRSPERSAQLYRQGVSKAKAGQSPHNYGMAVDIIHATRAWDLTKKEWAVLGAIGHECARKMELKVEWGGTWRFYDPAHWEIVGWKALRS
ncbi:hypothetical protein [Tortoise microvirus 81]|nr:hypothetical protein [Tortoise microvirus 81]